MDEVADIFPPKFELIMVATPLVYPLPPPPPAPAVPPSPPVAPFPPSPPFVKPSPAVVVTVYPGLNPLIIASLEEISVPSLILNLIGDPELSEQAEIP